MNGIEVVVVNLGIMLLLGASLIALAPAVMAVVGLLLEGLYLLVFRFTRRSLRRDGLAYTEHYQASLQVAQEGLGGISNLLLDQTQGFFLKACHQSQRRYRLAVASINIKAHVPLI